ncbi:MAG: hypothetical protein Q7S40_01685 [Opitutaceae bacterium]|nr:hypothetical protein [Opitutaceae bacterium]
MVENEEAAAKEKISALEETRNEKQRKKALQEVIAEVVIRAATAAAKRLLG